MDELIGKRLGNYEIESALGAGGMARVYKAKDTTLKRTVAIKVISPGLSADARYLERFEREAQAIAALEHPHIVPVYYFGKTESIYYLAMKFIEGEDLSVLSNRYAAAGEYLPYPEILRIIENIASALDYAHSKGVIHRDLKPSNIMIDADGRPYLTDFGLAMNLSQGSIGEVFGTPHYIAPEQAKNSASAVPQSDIYSLGVVLFELFTGIVPFDDPSPTAVALQHVMSPPPTPRSFNNDLSSNIEAVILKSLAKKPEDRFRSGAELTAALREAINNPGDPRERMEVPALPPLPPGMTPPPPRRVSMRPVAGEVRASMALRSQMASIATSTNTAPAVAQPTAAGVTKKQKSAQAETKVQPTTEAKNRFPMIVLGGIVVAVVLLIGLFAVLSSNNNGQEVAQESTIEQPTLFVAPTNTDIPTDIPTDVPTTIPTDIPTDIPVVPTEIIPPSAIPTDIPAVIVPTDVPPTDIPLPTAIPPTEVPAGPTLPADTSSPVRFLYNEDAFYWMNDSSRTISAEPITFAKVGGTEFFAGNRMAYYSMESGRCMQIMFADVAQQGCPEGRRPNSFFTPTRTQGIGFWTGGTGQFQVFWNGVHIATCEIAAGQCSAYIPR